MSTIISLLNNAVQNQFKSHNKLYEIYLTNRDKRYQINATNLLNLMITATLLNKIKKLKVLFQIKQDCKINDDFNISIFITACQHNCIEIVKYITNVDISAFQYRAFILACEYGNIEIVRYLCLNYQIDVTTVDNAAFRWACANGHLKVVKYLAQCNKINIADRDEFAMEYSCRNGHSDVVLFLLSLKDNWKCLDNIQRVPIEISIILKKFKRNYTKIKCYKV